LFVVGDGQKWFSDRTERASSRSKCGVRAPPGANAARWSLPSDSNVHRITSAPRSRPWSGLGRGGAGAAATSRSSSGRGRKPLGIGSARGRKKSRISDGPRRGRPSPLRSAGASIAASATYAASSPSSA
jgi:hypothetical protein